MVVLSAALSKIKEKTLNTEVYLYVGLIFITFLSVRHYEAHKIAEQKLNIQF